MINTIMFDFGDVFINLDKKGALEKAKSVLEVDPLEHELISVNTKYEVGGLSSDAFINYYCNRFKHLSKPQIVDLWNSIIVDFPMYRFEFIKDLATSGNYKLILLSNTNAIHIAYVKHIFAQFESFRNCFDYFYLSHEIKLRKPNLDIYQYVIQHSKTNPKNCLFIDDTKENTDAAMRLGFHTWNIDETKQDVTELFDIKRDLF
ncbi:MAG: HAD family phosphatase [Winogradskyella sp.]|nr:HAD family phosphatase [Winogradskyella sp.]NNF85395.1 HAD family phosphatase [Winogradskyella sp.]